MKKKRKIKVTPATYTGTHSKFTKRTSSTEAQAPALDAHLKKQKIQAPRYIMLNGVLTCVEDTREDY